MTVSPRQFRAGLIGSGIQASLTPAMHMMEGGHHGLDYRYELIDLNMIDGGVDNLPDLVADAEARGFSGLNITHPCKQLVIPCLDTLSDDARILNAVNTVVFRDGRRHGYNTDWSGFAEGFRRGLPDPRLDHVVQLGAGGAGAATAYAILGAGAGKLTILDQDGERAEGLAASMQAHFPSALVVAGNDPEKAMADADGLIHATPTGMARHPGLPLHGQLLRSHHWVAEIVYFPLETELLRLARSKGCRTLDGGGMAVFQAVGAFRLFTEIEPDAGRMSRHFSSLTAPLMTSKGSG